jgi:hypothetical protein
MINTNRPKVDKITTLEMEVQLAKYFGIRRNIVVPNVWWGMRFNHELDLLVITPSGHGYEIEIKISKSDLKADLKKPHLHNDRRLRELWFAIPESLADAVEFIPEDAGIIVVTKYQSTKTSYRYDCRVFRQPKRAKSAYQFTIEQQLKLAKLGTMRIWSLKQSLLNSRMNNE